jgi:hypothetical protein
MKAKVSGMISPNIGVILDSEEPACYSTFGGTRNSPPPAPARLTPKPCEALLS